MANPNKDRGTRWESAVRDYLNNFLGIDWAGDPAAVRRAAQEGAKDVGDLHAWPFIGECKDVKDSAVPTWLRQARVEAHHARYPYGVVIRKRRGAGTGAGAVHMDVSTFTRVRRALGLSSRQMFAYYGFTASFRGLDTGRWYMTTTLARFALILADIRSTDEGRIPRAYQ